MMGENYPKILVINQQSIFKKNATGITLQSTLKSWPKDKLMELAISPSENSISQEFSGIKTISATKATFPLRTLSNIRIFKKVNNNLKSTQKVQKTHYTQSKITKKEILRECFYVTTDLSSMFIGSNLKKEIDRFNPDVIYTLGGSVSVMKMSLYFSKRYDINIVIHFMDNWQETLQWDNNKLLKPYKVVMDRWLDKIYQHSVRALAISPQMAEVYTKRWNIPHYSLMNSIDINSMYCETKIPSETFCFVYAGGLHLQRWKSLQDISEAINVVSIELKRKIVLKIYTGKENKQQYQKNFNQEFVQFNDFVPHEKIKHIFNEADVLVHTEMDNAQMYGFFKYSISTKIPEYLSANRPMLFYGPQKLYLYQYLEGESAAFTASNKDELIQSIKQLVQSHKSKDIILRNGRMLALKNHDRKNADKVFYNAIVESVK